MIIVQLLLTLCISSIPALLPAADKTNFRAGVAAVDITPKIFPLTMPGGHPANMADGAHDLLHARAMVVVDNFGAGPDVLDEVREIAAAKTGIATEKYTTGRKYYGCYLDNLVAIEGVQLTLFHGLSAMGYKGGDLGYPDLLAVYRSVYQHVIRPAMWRRFSLSGPNGAKPETFSGRLYSWKDVSDDCWFRLPLLGQAELARLTGLATLQFVADRKTGWRHFTVADAERPKLLSPSMAEPGETDTAINNLLSLHTESCAVLKTATGHWLIVRPEVADVFAGLLAERTKAPVEVAGWLNEGVRPLLVFRASPALAVPPKEIGYFR